MKFAAPTEAKLGVRTLPELVRIAIQRLPSAEGNRGMVLSAPPGRHRKF